MTAKRVRILLVGLPPLLRELVEEALEAEPDLELVGDTEDAGNLGRLVERSRADAVLAGGQAIDEPRALALVGALRVRVVILTEDGRRAAVYECRPQRRDAGEVDPRTLADLLRTPDR